MRITDVALSAGVSPITASRAFDAPATVAPETLARVRRAVAQLCYVPNKSRPIAAIAPTVAHDRLNGTTEKTLVDMGFEVVERETL